MPKQAGKMLIRNESLQEICNGNGVKVVNFDTSTNSQSQMYDPASSPNGENNQIGHFLIDRQRHSSVLDGSFRTAGLAQDREAKSSCECGNESSGSIECWELSSGFRTGGLPSSSQLLRVSGC
jgi:hypothetical protein